MTAKSNFELFVPGQNTVKRQSKISFMCLFEIIKYKYTIKCKTFRPKFRASQTTNERKITFGIRSFLHHTSPCLS